MHSRTWEGAVGCGPLSLQPVDSDSLREEFAGKVCSSRVADLLPPREREHEPAEALRPIPGAVG
jgi:hypothetical protein